MNIELLNKIPRLALGSLWLVYILLGWYLSINHLVWMMGSLFVLITLVVAWKSLPLLKQWSWFNSRNLFVAAGLSLLISLSAVLLVTDFPFLGLVFLPLVTLLLADLEMRAAGFSLREVYLYLVVIAGFGLSLGEAIDLMLVSGIGAE